MTGYLFVFQNEEFVLLSNMTKVKPLVKNLSMYTFLPFIRNLLDKGIVDYSAHLGFIHPMTTSTHVYYSQIINNI